MTENVFRLFFFPKYMVFKLIAHYTSMEDVTKSYRYFENLSNRLQIIASNILYEELKFGLWNALFLSVTLLTPIKPLLSLHSLPN